MQPTHDQRDFARRYAAAWCSRIPGSVAEFYSPQGSLTVNSAPAARGRDEVAEIAEAFMTAFPDMKVTMDGLAVEGEHLIFRWTLTGTYTGPGGTGKRLSISGFERWRFGSDGLIAESQGHFDAAEYQRQLEHGVE
jgi:predicted ester cyclase